MKKLSNIEIFKRLNKLLDLAYSPYSNFKVSSIVEDDKGNYYEGVNVESATYTPGICAERNALNSAITKGMKPGSARKVFVLASPLSKNSFISPCGPCRQVISELSDNKAEVIMFGSNGNIKKQTISKLLPLAFSKKDLFNV